MEWAVAQWQSIHLAYMKLRIQATAPYTHAHTLHTTTAHTLTHHTHTIHYTYIPHYTYTPHTSHTPHIAHAHHTHYTLQTHYTPHTYHTTHAYYTHTTHITQHTHHHTTMGNDTSVKNEIVTCIQESEAGGSPQVRAEYLAGMHRPCIQSPTLSAAVVTHGLLILCGAICAWFHKTPQ